MTLYRHFRSKDELVLDVPPSARGALDGGWLQAEVERARDRARRAAAGDLRRLRRAGSSATTSRAARSSTCCSRRRTAASPRARGQRRAPGDIRASSRALAARGGRRGPRGLRPRMAHPHEGLDRRRRRGRREAARRAKRLGALLLCEHGITVPVPDSPEPVDCANARNQPSDPRRLARHGGAAGLGWRDVRAPERRGSPGAPPRPGRGIRALPSGDRHGAPAARPAARARARRRRDRGCRPPARRRAAPGRGARAARRPSRRRAAAVHRRRDARPAARARATPPRRGRRRSPGRTSCSACSTSPARSAPPSS